MKVKQTIFSVIFICIYICLNYYIGIRISSSIESITKLNPLAFWSIFWLLSFSYLIGRFLKNILSLKVVNILSVIGYYWLGIMFFSLAVFPIVDIIILIVNRINYNNINYNPQILTAISSLFILIIFLLLFFVGSRNARQSSVYTIDINKSETTLKERINIVMVSDIHLGTIVGNRRLEKMVNEINRLNPDIIVIAGDIVDTEIEPFMNSNMAKNFSNLKSTYGTFATLGNHDILLGKGHIITEELRKNNVTVLRDEAILINNDFYIIGRDDIVINKFGTKRKDLKDITRNLDEDKFKIIIDHTPSSIGDSLNEKVNIHFSGHTHKGQIAPGNLITKRIFEIDHGYLVKEKLNVIVSSGYGTWGPPIRLGSKSEIVNVIVE